MEQDDTKEVVRVLRNILTKLGFNYAESQILAVLLIANKPLTVYDIVKITGMSRSAVSTHINRLQKYYLVEYMLKGKVKYFKAKTSIANLFIMWLKDFYEKRLLVALKEVKDKEKLAHVLEDLEKLSNLIEKCLEDSSRMNIRKTSN